MKSDLYIKWDVYAKQNDNNFKRYCYRHIGYGFEVFFTTAIILKMNDGEAIAKDELTESIQAETLIDSDKVIDCINSLIELKLLKEEDGKYYSERVRRDVKEAQELSETRRNARVNKCKTKVKQETTNDNQMVSNDNQENIKCEVDNKTIDNKTIRQETSNKEIHVSQVKEKRFVPPTVDEIKAYCDSRHNDVNPQIFFDYYNDGNWKDSQGTPVKNWKQKMLANWVGKDWWKREDSTKRASSPHRGFNPEDYDEDFERLERGEALF